MKTFDDKNIIPFEELPKETQKDWNNFAEKQQKYLNAFSGLMSDGCVWCKKKYDRFSEMEFHIKSTHGVSPELLIITMGYDKP